MNWGKQGHRTQPATASCGAGSHFVCASQAQAATVVGYDAKGRAITLDIRAPDADPSWYVQIMRKTVHGDEIETAVIRIVPPRQIGFYCGAKAMSCYVGDSDTGTLTVPAGRGLNVVAVVRHEYAHHIDATYDLTLTEDSSNHAIGWWRARKIDERLRRGEVARSTRRGWERSIREIFAEDFVRMHTTAPYRIGWIGPPGGHVLDALRRDIRRAVPTYA